MSGAGHTFTLIDTRADGVTRGLCSLGDARLWDGDTPEDAHAAALMCLNCPIRISCLTNALNEEGSAHRTVRAGVRGGLTGQERESLWRRTTRKPAAA